MHEILFLTLNLSETHLLPPPIVPEWRGWRSLAVRLSRESSGSNEGNKTGQALPGIEECTLLLSIRPFRTTPNRVRCVRLRTLRFAEGSVRLFPGFVLSPIQDALSPSNVLHHPESVRKRRKVMRKCVVESSFVESLDLAVRERS